MNGERQDTSIGALLGRVVDGVSRLVTQHLELARLEIAEDARHLGAGLGRLAVFVPFVLVGYAFVCAAASVLLSRWVGLFGALALVGAANLLGGGLGLWRAATRLRSRDMMGTTRQELGRSAGALTATSSKEPPHGRQ